MLVKRLPIKKLIVFYSKQILILGSLAFGMWIFESWMRTGELWEGNLHALWLLTIVLAAIQLVTITTPLLMLLKRVRYQIPLYYMAAMMSGPLGVALFLWHFTQLPLDWYNYLIWPQSEHIIGATLSLGFAHNMRHLLVDRP